MPLLTNFALTEFYEVRWVPDGYVVWASASLVANPARVHFQVSPPQPLPLLPLRFVSQHVAAHAPYTDRGPRVGSKIVAPARVAVLAPVRSDERDPLAVGYPQYR
jgi:hypothetical protein